jgi:hypothetical protein
MPKLRLVILLILAFLPAASIGHLQAQFDPEDSEVCPLPSWGYGAAMSYFISSGAGGAGPPEENHKLANKTCFSQDLDLSDQKTMNSSTAASNGTTTYSYHVGHGRLNLQAEVKASGHKASIPIPGGTYHAIGRGGGNVIVRLRWVDTLTLHSATTKPAPKVNGAVIDPAQIVEIRLKLLNNGNNQCGGGGSESSYYTTSVALVAETSGKQVMGGHIDTDVDSDCKDQLNEGTIQVLLGYGQFRVELDAYASVNGYAQPTEGYAENVDVKVKLGEYQVCYQVVKEPADLKITSASGTDYACPKK